MSNARIQFSLASEEVWNAYNPLLKEGEIVTVLKANKKVKLVQGKVGGSTYSESTVIWDEDEAQIIMSRSEAAAVTATAQAAAAKNYSENVNVFLPSVSSEGVLEWTNKAGLTNPPAVNIKGATGAAATIEIGTVSTGAAGSNASVVNRGTANNAVFDFTLPRGADGGVTVDAALSDTSINPVQNKVINAALRGCAKQQSDNDLIAHSNEFNFANSTLAGGTLYINYRFADTGSIMDKGISSYRFCDCTNKALASISAADFNGYTIHSSVPANAKFIDNEASNTWAGQQTFNEAHIVKEVYQSEYINGTTITPTRSTMCLATTGATTLDMTNIVAECLGNNKTSTVFTAYITSNADYTLAITNAGTIKYIGSASDVAITSAGLLLNILMVKDASGNVTSIVQASKLEGGA